MRTEDIVVGRVYLLIDVGVYAKDDKVTYFCGQVTAKDAAHSNRFMVSDQRDAILRSTHNSWFMVEIDDVE